MNYDRYQFILVEKKDLILRLTLNRPDRMNAVNPALHTELTHIFADIRKDNDIKMEYQCLSNMMTK